MATSFMTKKPTEDERGEKIARSVTFKIGGQRGTNPNPNLWL
jgi:hypothetical protein